MEWHYVDGGGGQSLVLLEKESKAQGGGAGVFGLSYKLWGRVIGFVSLALLIVSMVLGGWPVRGWKPRMNARLGGLRRLKLHCGISYLILAVVMLHALLLMLKSYRAYAVGVIFSDISSRTGIGINLGDVSLILMLVVSLNGIFQRRLTRALGTRAWRLIHLYGTIAALILALIHTLMTGTTFAPIRGF